MAVCEGVHVLEAVVLRVEVTVAVVDALAPGDRLVVADGVGCGQKHMGCHVLYACCSHDGLLPNRQVVPDI